MTELPKLGFDPAEHSSDDRPEAWARYMSYMHKVQPLLVPERPFAAHAQSWVIERLVFSHVFFDPQTMCCKPGSSTVKGAPDILFGWIYRRGGAQIWHEGEMFDIGDNVFCLFDYSRELYSIAAQSEVYSIMVPHRRVGYDPLRHPARLILDLESADGALVAGELERVIRDADQMTRKDVPQEADRFSALLATLLNRNVRQAGEDQALKPKLLEYVDAHIFDQELSLTALMDVFDAPRGQIYAALDVAGKLDDYIARRRLDYALRSLAFGEANPKRTKDVAAYCGYTSLDAFEAAFSSQFGLPPKIALGAIARPDLRPELAEPADLWETWWV
ncbi:MAG: hypothetical protein ACE37M_12965 [Henriciella sp.]